jgi:hypothetical protein
LPCSRGPNEDCFSPPNGAWKSTPDVGWLMRIMPVSRPSTTVSAASRSCVNTDVTSPYATLLEISTACSAESAFSTVAIGPNTSSWASRALGSWPVTMAGATNRPGPSSR